MATTKKKVDPQDSVDEAILLDIQSLHDRLLERLPKYPVAAAGLAILKDRIAKFLEEDE